MHMTTAMRAAHNVGDARLQRAVVGSARSRPAAAINFRCGMGVYGAAGPFGVEPTWVNACSAAN
jgi:hypothetical protein